MDTHRQPPLASALLLDLTAQALPDLSDTASLLTAARQRAHPGALGFLVVCEPRGRAVSLAARLAGFELRDTVAYAHESGLTLALLVQSATKRGFVDLALGDGCGALNIDGGRIATSDCWGSSGAASGGSTVSAYGDGLNNPGRSGSAEGGRWPANLVFDNKTAAVIDAGSGRAKPKAGRSGARGGSNAMHMSRAASDNEFQQQTGRWPADRGGGASRFFHRAAELPDFLAYLATLLSLPGEPLLCANTAAGIEAARRVGWTTALALIPNP